MLRTPSRCWKASRDPGDRPKTHRRRPQLTGLAARHPCAGAAFAFGRVRVTIPPCADASHRIFMGGNPPLGDLVGQPRISRRDSTSRRRRIEVIRATAAGNELVPMYWGSCHPGGKATQKLPQLSRSRRDARRAADVSRRIEYRPASFRLRLLDNTTRRGPKTPLISRRAMAARWRSRGIWDHWSDSMAATTSERDIIVGEAMDACGASQRMRPFSKRGAMKRQRAMRPPPDDALQNGSFSTRVNRPALGRRSALIEPIEHAGPALQPFRLQMRRTRFARIDGAIDIAEDDWSLITDGISARRLSRARRPAMMGEGLAVQIGPWSASRSTAERATRTTAGKRARLAKRSCERLKALKNARTFQKSRT